MEHQGARPHFCFVHPGPQYLVRGLAKAAPHRGAGGVAEPASGTLTSASRVCQLQ